MARVVQLSALEAWARQLSGTENDPNITSAECTALANRHLTEVYDALVDAGPADYYAATITITTVAGTALYALPADFRNLLEVYAQESSTDLRLIHPIRPGERGTYRVPTGAWAVTVEYIPCAPTLVNAGDTFDGVSGWEELIANLMARDIMIKRDGDISAVQNSIGILQGRITSRARSRDKGHPKYIVDTDAQMSSFPWCSTTNSRINGYRLRAGNLELYEPLWGLP